MKGDDVFMSKKAMNDLIKTTAIIGYTAITTVGSACFLFMVARILILSSEKER
jgi:hypothetical protein